MAVDKNVIIGLVTTLVVVAYVFPVGISALYEMNTTGWGADVTRLSDLFPLFAVIAVLIGIISWVKTR